MGQFKVSSPFLEKGDFKQVSEDSSLPTPMEYVMRKLLSLGESVTTSFFPHLTKVVEIIFTLPMSNAWPERGFSKLKLTKTTLRNILQNDILQSLLQVSLNGPKPCSEHADTLIQNSVYNWKAVKARRKLPRVPLTVPSTPVENECFNGIAQQEYEKALRVLRLAKFAQKVAELEDDAGSESEN
ncbi:unnamed protein product [Mytilus coruscus]|uniref:HAT C-terminal dimerisation domain-containing protein n=1 Tax=Mytilus coruscus TaxID=42192 RepID=A0A6J8BKN0_MYTCO|nr:unnamed protein product [Mytilus coruscus]